jgi:hypothetical protein
MAQRWVTEEELNSMQNQYAEGGNVQESNLINGILQSIAS